MVHLAIMDRKTIEMILAGEKVIESRFSKNKITPFNKVSVGETVYLKESGKDIVASFEIEKIIFYDNLIPEKVNWIKEKYNNLIKAPTSYWNYKLSSKYGTLMYIKNTKEIKQIKISKKNRQGFVSYDEFKVL
jgi:predicted transcriptional regulator